MADLYSAAFDFARLNLGAVSAGVNGATFAGGTLSGTVGFATGMYVHGNVQLNAAPSVDGVALGAWCDDFKAQVTGTLVMAFDPNTCRYILSCASTFSITWNGALGLALSDILGFEADLAGQTSYISTKRPRYTIISVVAGQSKDSGTREAPGGVEVASASNGFSFSVTEDEIATERDWSQVYETPTGPTDAAWTASPGVGGAPVRITNIGVATKVDWTWEQFYKHVRATLPFVLVDRATSTKGEGDLYKIRDGMAATWNPGRVREDFDGHWDMPFKVRFIDGIKAL